MQHSMQTFWCFSNWMHPKKLLEDTGHDDHLSFTIKTIQQIRGHFHHQNPKNLSSPLAISTEGRTVGQTCDDVCCYGWCVTPKVPKFGACIFWERTFWHVGSHVRLVTVVESGTNDVRVSACHHPFLEISYNITHQIMIQVYTNYYLAGAELRHCDNILCSL